MNANIDNLPHWARVAFRHAGAPLVGDTDPEGRPYPRPRLCPEGFAERVAGRWPEIERDVLPELPDSLSEIGKANFFEFVFRQTMYGAVVAPRQAPDAVRRLDDVRTEILKTALQLASLLQDHAAIYEEGTVDCDMPDLWDLIEEAAADYPAWEMTAQPAMERFLTVATSQSRAGPCVADVLERLAEKVRFSPPPRTTDPAYRNCRASNADHVQLLTDAISRYPLRRRADGRPRDDIAGGDAACLPADFVVPDSAMATLVSVLFDLPAGEPSVEAVRELRLSR